MTSNPYTVTRWQKHIDEKDRRCALATNSEGTVIGAVVRVRDHGPHKWSAQYWGDIKPCGRPDYYPSEKAARAYVAKKGDKAAAR
jgi:hypothetical protein